MKTKLCFYLLLFAGMLSVNAQGYHYYYKGSQIPLTLNRSHLNITVKPDFQKSSISATRKLKDFVLEDDNSTGQNLKFAKLEFTDALTESDFFKLVNALRNKDGVKNVSFYFDREGAPPIGTSSLFYVKLKNSTDLPLLQQVADKTGAAIAGNDEFMPLWYKLVIQPGTSGSAIDLTNAFYDTGLFEEIDPAFMFNFGATCTNDTNFSQLWGLYNSSNTSLDINACDAWNITQGSGINVAILDQGIDKPHNDLVSNISPLSYNTATATSPSVFTSGYAHGTHVGGTVAAIKDNNLQVVGVAPQSKLISVSNKLDIVPNLSQQLAGGMNWAWQNGAHIINNSWGDHGGAFYSSLHSALLETAIQNALTLGRGGLGTVVVFSAGNTSPAIDYPAYFDDRIAVVGAMTSTGSRSSFSGYGTQLDVVAPGSAILSTTPGNSTATWDGTSMASPHVSGVSALILSVNPCLTGQQVRDIIETTSQKVGGYSYTTQPGKPNGTWNDQMGYGLIDALAAVQLAQQMYSAGLDLYVKDTPDDHGVEPNTISPYMWNSSDIWVRNQSDFVDAHQNPEYSATVPNYVYVRVINKSCVASTGSEQLGVYWTKAGTSLGWPSSWNGTFYVSGALMGAPVAVLNIPALAPGEETVVEFPWLVPNPATYNGITPEPWHFCLLARIITPNDPMTVVENTNIDQNTRNNNNIAWKNITIVDNLANAGGVVGVGNPFTETKKFNLEFLADAQEAGNKIFEEAQVSIKMDEHLFQAWAIGGRQVDQKKIKFAEENRFVVLADNLVFKYLVLNPNELGTLNLTFHFPETPVSEKNDFTYHIVQRDAETNEIIGGETYKIKRDPGSIATGVAQRVAGPGLLAIAPNPASHNVAISYRLTGAKVAYLTVEGYYGSSLLSSNTYALDKKSAEKTIDISGYPDGLYTVSLVCDGKTVDTKTLVKQ